jgi:hypothetical protein
MQLDIIWCNKDNTLRIVGRQYNSRSLELVAQGVGAHEWYDEQRFNVADAEQAEVLVKYLQGFIEARLPRISHSTAWNVFGGVLWVGGVPTIMLSAPQNTPGWAELLSLMLTNNVTRSLFSEEVCASSDVANEEHILNLIEQCGRMNEF